ncbi:MAG: guanylate kinase [Chloroflexi bacterium]|nr:guanylate kinase [Chloroflexota bacterium]MBM3154924.1 guanylate kinase [Chloroflexota bacterium]MBM3173188.1 guanylate kinase [Chloroflexota bacterium]MBM3175164.1 guanylate kinase [Chloroflexota bacterium]MBM4449936.1 guanylate kinase [Chloroflexota bacterium]
MGKGERKKLPLPANNPLLVVISGPSGVGKDAAIAKMKELGLPFYHVVTTTTRPKRASEKDGIDYRFVSEEGFKRQIKSNELLEWAKVYDNYYGVPKKDVEKALKRGQDVVLKVDVQGAATVKRLAPEAIFIFLMPPSKQELANRLRKRHGHLGAELKVRLDKALQEMECLPMFDYVVITHNDELEATAREIAAIVVAEKCRLKARTVKL